MLGSILDMLLIFTECLHLKGSDNSNHISRVLLLNQSPKAIATNLALDQEPLTAVKAAKAYITQALNYALDIGQGQGLVD